DAGGPGLCQRFRVAARPAPDVQHRPVTPHRRQVADESETFEHNAPACPIDESLVPRLALFVDGVEPSRLAIEVVANDLKRTHGRVPRQGVQTRNRREGARAANAWRPDSRNGSHAPSSRTACAGDRGRAPTDGDRRWPDVPVARRPAGSIGSANTDKCGSMRLHTPENSA